MDRQPERVIQGVEGTEEDAARIHSISRSENRGREFTFVRESYRQRHGERGERRISRRLLSFTEKQRKSHKCVPPANVSRTCSLSTRLVASLIIPETYDMHTSLSFLCDPGEKGNLQQRNELAETVGSRFSLLLETPTILMKARTLRTTTGTTSRQVMKSKMTVTLSFFVSGVSVSPLPSRMKRSKRLYLRSTNAPRHSASSKKSSNRETREVASNARLNARRD